MIYNNFCFTCEKLKQRNIPLLVSTSTYQPYCQTIRLFEKDKFTGDYFIHQKTHSINIVKKPLISKDLNHFSLICTYLFDNRCPGNHFLELVSVFFEITFILQSYISIVHHWIRESLTSAVFSLHVAEKPSLTWKLLMTIVCTSIIRFAKCKEELNKKCFCNVLVVRLRVIVKHFLIVTCCGHPTKCWSCLLWLNMHDH